MNRHLFFLFMVLFTGIVFTACDKTVVYEKYQAIPESQWHKDSLVVFQVPVTDTLQNHNLLIDIRNETSYPYSNLWLFIEIIHPEGKTVKDTFELVLADPSGKWMGDGIGAIKTRQTIYRRNIFFPKKGQYTVKIRHGMRENKLNGIHDVGFRIEKVK